MEGPSLPKTFLVLVVVVGAKPAGSSGSDGIVLGVSNSGKVIQVKVTSKSEPKGCNREDRHIGMLRVVLQGRNRC